MSEHAARPGDKPSGGEDGPGDGGRRIQAYLEAPRRRGDRKPTGKAEWDRLVRSHEPLILNLARARHRSEEDCDDRAQEIWLMLINRLPALPRDPGRGNLRAWISTAGRRRLINYEKCRRSHPMRRLGPEAAGQLAGREPDPADAVAGKLLQELVRDALVELRQQVTPRDYEAFVLRWVNGWSVRAIAARLQMTERQVWSSHHRTRQKLRPLLARRLAPDDLT